jgi:hypothetical protein
MLVTNHIRSPEDIERLLSNMGLPFQAPLAAARQVNERFAALGEGATPNMRRSAIEDAYAIAVRDNRSE